MAVDTSMFSEEDLRYFDKGHTGDPIGWGERPALVIVDMTRAFVEEEYPLACEKTGRPCAAAIGRLLEASRNAEIPVLYTGGIVADKEILKGRWKSRYEDPLLSSPKAHEIVEEVTPLDDEIVIRKTKPSGFFGTELNGYLIYHNVDTLIVTGMVTSGCVRATVVDAFSLNYRVIVPEECVADRAELSHQVTLVDLDTKYADVMPVDDVIAHLESITKVAAHTAQ